MLSGRRLRADFVGADLDAGFALVHLAELQIDSGAGRDASRVLREAEDALLDGRRRLSTLVGADYREFRPDFDRLRSAIRRARSRCRNAKRSNVISFPATRRAPPRGGP